MSMFFNIKEVASITTDRRMSCSLKNFVLMSVVIFFIFPLQPFVLRLHEFRIFFFFQD